MATEYRHDPDAARYVISVDGTDIGATDYRVRGDEIVFFHTEIEPDRREAGLASGLVRFALDDVRERSQLRVVPECSYVQRWIDEHPEYRDLTTR